MELILCLFSLFIASLNLTISQIKKSGLWHFATMMTISRAESFGWILNNYFATLRHIIKKVLFSWNYWSLPERMQGRCLKWTTLIVPMFVAFAVVIFILSVLLTTSETPLELPSALKKIGESSTVPCAFNKG